MPRPPITCELIGDDELLVQCGVFLLETGAKISAVSSLNPRVEAWAREHGLPFYSTLKVLAEANSVLPDFIFSLSNTRILKRDFIARARVKVINVHNSYLPHHGGVNATHFAILEAHESHGVTIHTIEDERVDVGKIVSQRKVEILPDDTAYSLNVRCHEIAVNLFREMYLQLSSDQGYDWEQLVDLSRLDSKLVTHHLSDKPPGNGLINWKCGADEILRVFRATITPSGMPNQFALPKILLVDQLGSQSIVIPTMMRKAQDVLPKRSDPGTIVGLAADHIRVATLDDDIIISGLRDPIRGNPIDLQLLATEKNLLVGEQLPIQHDDRLAQALLSVASEWRDERAAVREWEKAAPVRLPFMFSEEVYSQESLLEEEQIEWETSERKVDSDLLEFIEAEGCEPTIAMLTGLLAYIQRVCDVDCCSVLFSVPESGLPANYRIIHPFISRTVPLTVRADLRAMNFQQAYEHVKKLVKNLTSRRLPAVDIFQRYPMLSHADGLPIAVQLRQTNGLKSLELPRGSEILVSFDHPGEGIFKFCTKTKRQFEQVNSRLHKHLMRLMAAIRDAPDIRLGNLDFLPDDEQDRLRILTGPVDQQYQERMWPHERIFHQVERDARLRNQVAVATVDYSGVEKFTIYQELDRDSRRLARGFQTKCDLKKGDRVLICLKPSADLVKALYAVMLSGGVFVLSDPDSPSDFIKQELDENSPKIIITTSDVASKFKESSSPVLLINSRPWDEMIRATSPREYPVFHPDSEDIACITYTSGMTRRKGVKISYASLRNALEARTDRYSSDPSELMNQLFLFRNVFDTAVHVILWTLIAKGRLTFDSFSDQVFDAKRIVDNIRDRQITHLTCVPALYGEILKAGGEGDFKTLRTVILGGDACAPSLLEMHRDKVSGSELVIEYGTAETGCWSVGETVYKPASDTQAALIRPITIGSHPIPNVDFQVVDSRMQPMPPGVPGELLIAGVSNMLGYTGEEQARIVVLDDQQWLRTGDRVVLSQEGLKHLGRLDSQVKIHGCRVEPSQVETALQEFPGIDACIVTAKEDPQRPREKILVAFVVLAESETSETKEFNPYDILEFLRRKLPPYYLPRLIIPVSEFSQTFNMKIVRELSIPATNPRAITTKPMLPENSVQSKIADIWKRVLGIGEELGIDDSFFDLGGSSIDVSQMLQSVRKLLSDTDGDYTLPVNDFYGNPTIRTLAALISKDKCFKNDIVYRDDLSSLDNFDELSSIFKPLETKSLFLTGATGFVGSVMLSDLLAKYSHISVHCLIRATDLAQARKKLREVFERYSLDLDLLSRVHIHLGDLAKEKFGMDAKQYRELANSVDLIIHCAAEVHHLKNYENLRATNVLGVLRLLDFMKSRTDGSMIPLSHLSVLHAGVTTDKDGDEWVPEAVGEIVSKFPEPIAHAKGYAQTKWVADQLCLRAQQKGLPVKIFRLPLVVGHEETGAGPLETYHIWSVVKQCLLLGKAPDWHLEISMLPVSWVSKFIIETSLSDDIEERSVFNLHSDKGVVTWGELLGYFREITTARGPEFCKMEDWLRALNALERPATPGLFVRALYSNVGDRIPNSPKDIRNEGVKRAMQALSLVFPNKFDYLAAIFRYMSRQTYFSTEFCQTSEITPDKLEELGRSFLPLSRKDSDADSDSEREPRRLRSKKAKTSLPMTSQKEEEGDSVISLTVAMD